MNERGELNIIKFFLKKKKQHCMPLLKRKKKKMDLFNLPQIGRSWNFKYRFYFILCSRNEENIQNLQVFDEIDAFDDSLR